MYFTPQKVLKGAMSGSLIVEISVGAAFTLALSSIG